MIDVAISQVTTPRWDLSRDLAHLVEHGFTSLALWRSKVSDAGVPAAATGAGLAAVATASAALRRRFDFGRRSVVAARAWPRVRSVRCMVPPVPGATIASPLGDKISGFLTRFQ